MITIVEPRWHWNSFLFGVKSHWKGCVTKYHWVSIGFFSFYIIPKESV